MLDGKQALRGLRPLLKIVFCHAAEALTMCVGLEWVGATAGDQIRPPGQSLGKEMVR